MATIPTQVFGIDLVNCGEEQLEGRECRDNPCGDHV